MLSSDKSLNIKRSCDRLVGAGIYGKRREKQPAECAGDIPDESVGSREPDKDITSRGLEDAGEHSVFRQYSISARIKAAEAFEHVNIVWTFAQNCYFCTGAL